MYGWDVQHKNFCKKVSCCQFMCCVEPDKPYDLAENQHFKNMFLLPVSCFMSQYCYYLVIHMIGQQGIKQDNPFHMANACKISIAMTASLGRIHGKHPVNLQAGPGQSLFNPPFQRCVFHGLELVK